MAITLKLSRNGAVGFIDWLDLFIDSNACLHVKKVRTPLFYDVFWDRRKLCRFEGGSKRFGDTWDSVTGKNLDFLNIATWSDATS